MPAHKLTVMSNSEHDYDYNYEQEHEQEWELDGAGNYKNRGLRVSQ